MNQSAVVQKPKPRRSPSWLEFIGFSVLFVLVVAGVEGFARAVVGNSWVDWLYVRFGWTVLFFWACRQMGWQP